MSEAGAGRSARRLGLAAALVGSAALAGCSSGKGSAAPASTAVSTTASTGTAPPTTAAPATTTTIPGCTGDNYALSVLGSSGAAGTEELTLGLRNTSSATCPMEGYPGVQLLDAAAVELVTTTVRGGALSFTNFAPAPVSIGPGQIAYVNLGYSDVPTGTTPCMSAAALEIVPPGTSTALRVSVSVTACDNGTVNVSPVFGRSSPETQTTAPASS